MFSAIKEDGRLYTRQNENGVWADYTRHGLASWTEADVDQAPDGTIALIGTKDSGRLWTRSHDTQWGSYTAHGADTWSPQAQPSTAATNGSAILLAVKTDGRLFTRNLDS